MSSKIVLCDIEGTTTSISFVKDNLFPYAAKNVETFLAAHWDREDTKEAVRMLREQSAADKRDNVDGCVEIGAGEEEDKAKQIESIAANVKWQIEHDRKATPLKNLQGLMWVEAYKAGEFKGHVFEDVAPALEAWTKAGWKVYIYSSGSAAIQKVHFEYSEAGDLAKYLSGYFDTKVGAKQEKASYEAIWKEIGKGLVEGDKMTVKDVLFLTDIPGEARAAKEAGMEAFLLKRPGNAELTEEDEKTFKVVDTFKDIPVAEEKKAENVVVEKMEDETSATAIKRKIDDVGKEDVTPPAKLAKIEEASEAVPAVDPPQIESKTEEKETKDVPMAKAEADEVVLVVNKEATKEVTAPTVEPVTDEDEKTEERMEVDSTTAAVAVAEKVAEQVDAKVEEKTVKETEEIETTEKEDQKESVTEEKEAQAAAEVVAKVTEEKDAISVVEKADNEEMEKEKEKEPAKENGKSEEEKEAVKNGNSAEEKEAVKNGDEQVAQNGNENGEKKGENGHDDSDKENDKSMEVNPADEVSTTSATAAETPAVADTESDSTSEAIAAAKKIAAIDPVSTAPAAQGTPIPAEVQAES